MTLVGSLDFFFEAGEVGGVPIRSLGVSRVEVGVWSVGVCHMVGPLRAQGYLDALDGIEQVQSECAIEGVEVQRVLKAGSVTETMSAVVCFEGQPVGGKTIVVDMPKAMAGVIGGVYAHPALAQQRDLFVQGRGSLAEFHFQRRANK